MDYQTEGKYVLVSAGAHGIGKDAALKPFLEDRHMPLGIGQPEDVVQAIAFLASPLAKYITGAALDIGGTLGGLI